MESRSLVPWPDREDVGRLMEWPQRVWSQMMRDMPTVEVADEGDALLVRVEIPGVDPDDIDVEVTQQQVTVRGEIRQSSGSESQGIYHSERRYGRFHRSVPLPVAIDPESAQASYRNGLLEIRLPHSGAGRRKLRVQSGEQRPH
ncbi:MAG: Hsp20/alpha crystallin family protein [Thermaerobacter sp.]|nr:Hsp20/alpha crystallin family protein [Thermaerobacter sp.]